jgi:hypothetical protein
LLVAAPGVAIAGTLIAHAGFSERGQVAFVALAFAALLVAGALDPESLRAAATRPVVLVLALLGVLAGSSAAWTIGGTADALLWGAVVLGYAAIAACGFVARRRGGPSTVPELLVLLAVVTGLIGVVAAGFQEEPFAERIGGAWRPGGPFEYAPALGALSLAALPLALRWMAGTGRRALGGALAVTVCAAAVALISSRAVLALGLLLALAVLLRPETTIRSGRPMAVAVIAFAITAGAAADAIAGSYDEPYSKSADLFRIVGLALLVPAAVALWAAVRRRFDAAGVPVRARRAGAVALTLLPLALACTAAALTPDSGASGEPDAGLTHGRVEIWDDALETALEGPVEGSGALTFLSASIVNQDPPAARFAHNLLLEQWVELGYPGLLASLAFVAVAIGLVVRSRGTPSGWLLAPAAIVYLVAALIDWPWHVPASAAIFVLVLGALSAEVSDAPPKGRPQGDGPVLPWASGSPTERTPT